MTPAQRKIVNHVKQMYSLDGGFKEYAYAKYKLSGAVSMYNIDVIRTQ